MPLIEVCVASLKSAIAAQQGGAHRIELCDNLYEGGTTPSIGMIERAIQSLSIDVHVIIRPRGGDFFYSDDEFQIMKSDIRRCKQLGVNGVVIGCLLQNGEIDKTRTTELLEEARPMSVTFHRAIDMTPDPLQALSVLIELGVDRVLTSGGENSAVIGLKTIQAMIKMAKEHIIIMPGAGLDEENIETFAKAVAAKEYHATLRKVFLSPMKYRKDGVFMGGLPAIPEFDRKDTDPDKVRKFVRILKNLNND